MWIIGCSYTCIKYPPHQGFWSVLEYQLLFLYETTGLNLLWFFPPQTIHPNYIRPSYLWLQLATFRRKSSLKSPHWPKHQWFPTSNPTAQIESWVVWLCVKKRTAIWTKYQHRKLIIAMNLCHEGIRKEASLFLPKPWPEVITEKWVGQQCVFSSLSQVFIPDEILFVMYPCNDWQCACLTRQLVHLQVLYTLIF